MAKKKTQKKKKGNGEAANPNAPKIIESKGGLTAAKLLREINTVMDSPLTLAALKDLQNSVETVVTDQLQQGKPVNLFGLVKIVPRLHTKGERMVNEEFGNPKSKKVLKKYSPKTSLKTGQGIFTKRVKDAMPSVQKLTKVVGK